MPLAGTAAITEVWAKCKAWYGRKLGASTTATTASIQLKNNAGDNLGDAATIGAATSASAGVMTADMYSKLDGIEAGAQANDVTGVKGSSESAYRTGNVSLTAANVGAAASSHTHGNITSGGDITATAPTVASGDKLVINDESASKITNGPSFGTSQTTYLRNDGTWGTPAGTYSHPSYTAITEGLRKVGRDATGHVVSTSAVAKSDITALGIPAQDTTYSDFTGATSTANGARGLVPPPGASSHEQILTNSGTWENIGAVLHQENTSNIDSGFVYIDGENDEEVVFYGGRLMTSEEKTKLSGIATGATANAVTTTTPKMDGTAAVGSETAYAKGDHVHPTDTSRAPVSHASSATTYGKGTNANYGHVKLSDSTSATTAAASGGTAATPKAVSDALASAKTYADGVADDALNDAKDYADSILSSLSGAALFCGTLGTSGADYTQAQLEATSYEAGWYWVVSVAGTYVGQSCEVGDMVFAVKDKVSSYKASDFSVVQNNVVEMTAAEVDAICV